MMKPVNEMDEEELSARIGNRQHLQHSEMEQFLLSTIRDEYEERQRKHWDRDYSSVESYRDSVAPNRERWREMLGEFGPGTDEFDPETRPYLETDGVDAEWVSIKLFDDPLLRGRAIVGVPTGDNGPYPLVICQHGLSGSPDEVFGYDDPKNLYHAYARRLVEDGFAVVAPLNVSGDEQINRKGRLCKMLGKTLWGLEVFRTERFLDYLSEDSRIDADRIAMWGLSRGGTYTLFTVPAVERIDVGICSAFYNDRIRKMVVDDQDSIYTSYITGSSYEHMFLKGWLREFKESDLTSLICPRPFMVQTGKSDAVAWWPWVEETAEEALEHYERLDVGERFRFDLHDGGHEIDYDAGVAFLREYL